MHCHQLSISFIVLISLLIASGQSLALCQPSTINIAKCQSYTLDPIPTYDNPSPNVTNQLYDDTDLTDGIYVAANHGSDRSVTWRDADFYTVLIDLNAPNCAVDVNACHAIDDIRISVRDQPGVGVSCPESAIFEVSDDGIHYFYVQGWERPSSYPTESCGQQHINHLNYWVGRYGLATRGAFVRVTLEADKTNSSRLVFIDEIEINAGIDSTQTNYVPIDYELDIASGITIDIDAFTNIEAPLTISNEGALTLSGVDDPIATPVGLAEYAFYVQTPGHYDVWAEAKNSQGYGVVNRIAIDISTKPTQIEETTELSDTARWVPLNQSVFLAPGWHSIVIGGADTSVTFYSLHLHRNIDYDLYAFEAENTDYLEDGAIAVSAPGSSANKHVYASGDEAAIFYNIFMEEAGDFRLRASIRNTNSDENPANVNTVINATTPNIVSIAPSDNFSWVNLGVYNTPRATANIVIKPDTGIEIDRLIAESTVISSALSGDTFLAQTQSYTGFSPASGAIQSVTNNASAAYAFSVAEAGLYQFGFQSTSDSTDTVTVSASINGNLSGTQSIPPNQPMEWQIFNDTVELQAGSHSLELDIEKPDITLHAINLKLTEYKPKHVLQDNSRQSQTFYATSLAMLTTQLASAVPGDQFILADGTYHAGELFVSASLVGSAEKPIIIQPTSADGVILTGDAKVAIYGQHIQLSGFQFNSVGPNAIIIAGAYNSFSNHVIRNSGLSPTHAILRIPKGSFSNRIANNDISDSLSISVQITTPLFGIDEPYPLNNQIIDNHFHNIDNPNINGREAIQIGGNSTPYEAVKTLVKGNRFEQANGDGEIISIKSHGNIIDNSLFLNSEGELVLRNSSRSKVINNRLINTTLGIRVSGAYNLLDNNFIHIGQSNAFRLTRGCVGYTAVQHNTFSNNIIVTDEGAVEVLDWTCTPTPLLEVEDNIFTGNIFKTTNVNAQLFRDRAEIDASFFLQNNNFNFNVGDIAGSGANPLYLPDTGITLQDVPISYDANYQPVVDVDPSLLQPSINIPIPGTVPWLLLLIYSLERYCKTKLSVKKLLIA